MRAFSTIKVIQKLTRGRLLTCEGEIISFLIENGPSRPRDLIKNIDHSQVSIFNKLKQLSEVGILEKTSSECCKHTNYQVCHEIMSVVFEFEVDPYTDYYDSN